MPDTPGTPIVVDDRSGIARTATEAEERELEEHDGVIGEPGQWVRNVLWFLAITTMCLAVLALVGAIVLLAFVPLDPPGAADAATLVAVLGSVLTALVSFYSARQRR